MERADQRRHRRTDHGSDDDARCQNRSDGPLRNQPTFENFRLARDGGDGSSGDCDVCDELRRITTLTSMLYDTNPPLCSIWATLAYGLLQISNAII